MAKIRNHQVPRLLLREFATDGRLDVRLRSGRIRSVGISDAAVQKHFYAYVDADGVRNDEVEDYLDQNVEAPFAPVLHRLLDGATVDGDRDTVAWFVAWQAARSPRFRALGDEFARVLGPLLAGFDRTVAWARDRPSGWSERDARAVFDLGRANPPDEYAFEGDSNSSIRLMFRQAVTLAAAFQSAHWCIAEIVKPGLVLADSPVELFRPTAGVGGFDGYKFTPTTEVRMPLSPRHVLLGTTVALSPPRFSAPAELISSVNAGQGRECQHAVLGPPDSLALRALALAPTPPSLPEPNIHLRQGDPAARTVIEFPPLNDPVLEAIQERTAPPRS